MSIFMLSICMYNITTTVTATYTYITNYISPLPQLLKTNQNQNENLSEKKNSKSIHYI